MNARLAAILALVLLVSATIVAAHQPNVIQVGLEGYSPISYFEQDGPAYGSPEFAAEHEGVTYLLRSSDERKRFLADPDRYAPAYGGWCAFGMAVEQTFPIDPKNYKIVNGRLMLFLRNEGIDARELWSQGDPVELRKKADAHWKTVSG